MRVLMTEDSNNAVSNSFLLDDDSRLAITFHNEMINLTLSVLPLSFFLLFQFGMHFSESYWKHYLLAQFFFENITWNNLTLFLRFPQLLSFCSIPFSVDDISKSMEQIDIADIEPPPLIRENSGFSFLLPRSD